MLQLAVYPPSRATPHNTDFAGQPFGKVDPEPKTGDDLRAALNCAKTWEVFQYIDAFFKETVLFDESETSGFIERYAKLGNVDIVRKLLDAGAKTHGGPRLKPLQNAARYGKADVVDLLLERGADPYHRSLHLRGFPNFPLFAAFRGDSLAIVRKLLDHGATVNADWRLLDIAFKHEITAMLEFLLEHFDVRYNYVSLPDSDYRRVLKKKSSG